MEESPCKGGKQEMFLVVSGLAAFVSEEEMVSAKKPRRFQLLEFRRGVADNISPES
jgi:hypothetical protein